MGKKNKREKMRAADFQKPFCAFLTDNSSEAAERFSLMIYRLAGGDNP